MRHWQMSFDESVCVKETGRRREGGSRLIAANVPLLPCPFNLPRTATDNQEVNHESIKGSLSQGSFQTVEALSQISHLKQLARVRLESGMGNTRKHQLQGRTVNVWEHTSSGEHLLRGAEGTRLWTSSPTIYMETSHLARWGWPARYSGWK